MTLQTWLFLIVLLFLYSRGGCSLFPSICLLINILPSSVFYVQLQSFTYQHTKKWDRTGQLGAGGDIVPVSYFSVALLSGSTMQLEENHKYRYRLMPKSCLFNLQV